MASVQRSVSTAISASYDGNRQGSDPRGPSAGLSALATRWKAPVTHTYGKGNLESGACTRFAAGVTRMGLILWIHGASRPVDNAMQSDRSWLGAFRRKWQGGFGKTYCLGGEGSLSETPKRTYKSRKLPFSGFQLKQAICAASPPKRCGL